MALNLQPTATGPAGTVSNPHLHAYDCRCVCHHTPPGPCPFPALGLPPCACKPCADCGMWIDPAMLGLHAVTCALVRVYGEEQAAQEESESERDGHLPGCPCDICRAYRRGGGL